MMGIYIFFGIGVVMVFVGMGILCGCGGGLFDVVGGNDFCIGNVQDLGVVFKYLRYVNCFVLCGF